MKKSELEDLVKTQQRQIDELIQQVRDLKRELDYARITKPVGNQPVTPSTPYFPTPWDDRDRNTTAPRLPYPWEPTSIPQPWWPQVWCSLQ